MRHAYIIGVLLGSLSTASAAELTIRKVAMTGDEAPGTGGLHLRFLGGQPLISRTGIVSFGGAYGPIGSPDGGSGLWRQPFGESATLVAARGMTAIGTGGGSFDEVGSALINAAGDMAFHGRLKYDSSLGIDHTNWEGLFVADAAGRSSLTARQGATAPGSGGGVFAHLREGNWWQQSFNSAGHMLFMADTQIVNRAPDGSVISAQRGGEGIWQSDASGQLSMLAQSSKAAPGVGEARFGILSPAFGYTLGLNDSGRTAFAATLYGPGVTTSNDSGVWATDPSGAPQLLVREGDATPGIAGGVFLGLIDPAINGAGELVFFATHRVGGQNRNAVWRANAEGNISTIVEQGDPAPGGREFVWTGDYPFINSQGRAAFRATLRSPAGSSESSLWTETAAGQLLMLGREGLDAPEASGADFDKFSLPSINARGDVLLNASLQQGENGVTVANDDGVWLYHAPLNEMLLLARTGMLWDVNDDPAIEEFRTISWVGATSGSGGEDGRRNGLSDAGEVLLYMTFADGSVGLFVVQAVPELSAFWLAATGSCYIAARRRSSRDR